MSGGYSLVSSRFAYEANNYETHLFQKPSLKKSSSATAYSLTTPLATDAQPPSSSKAKLKAVPIGQNSQPGPSTVNRRDIRSLRPSMPALTKSSSWPSRPAVAARTTAGESSRLAGSQRYIKL